MESGREYAERMDREDPLARFRDHFYIPANTVYFDGNSLGLMPREGRTSLDRVITEWETLAIRGWLGGNPPWFYLAEQTGAQMALLVGAEPEEVVAAGSTTVNIHALISSFYRPSGRKTKILADALNFPSDIYALKSQLMLRGYDPETNLVTVQPGPDFSLSEEKVIEAMKPDIALVFLPSVLFRTGQLIDIPLLASEAAKRGILFGLDCSHSAGAVPHEFDRQGVDFATWCGYKYLNGGPGSAAFVYVNRKHFSLEPMMAGWFGYLKEQMFNMSLDFVHQPSAGGWQISTPNLLSLAPLEGSIGLIHEAGIDRIREKSLRLTSYLIELVDHLLSRPPYNFYIRTPKESGRRGGHVAIGHASEAWRVCEALKSRGFIPDFRPPDIIRIAPVALYNSFTELWDLTNALREIIDGREYELFDTQTKAVS